ncbi:GIY-YIG nuclease family protein [Massilia sp. DWR3-1-1]|uniref:GIY-YIG nuclease family protein n=1 Tax=Massilia sp. DWR3-1-1 TaxID=2804559 RepID=UPI003CF459BA
MRPFTLRIFLPSGDPSGVLVATRDDGIGKAIIFPRALLGEVKGRKEWNLLGVYLLVGQSKLYIGEGDPAGKRLEDHATKKTFWDKALFFTADNRLNKAHIQHLEARLIKLASGAIAITLDNGNQPQVPALGEEEYAFAENVLADLLLMLPLLGITQFVSPVTATDEIASEESSSGEVAVGRRAGIYSSLPRGMLFSGTHKEANATLEIVEGGVWLKKGSTVVREPVPSFETYCAGYAQMRRQLLESGVIADLNGKLTLTEDQFFSSASAAACVMRGINSNADNWISADKKNLGDLLRALKQKNN